jgi:hypothetical protein
MVQRLWRRIYAGYWRFRVQHAATVSGIVVGSAVMISSLWTTMSDGAGGTEDGAEDSRKGAATTRFGRRLVASFGRLWERSSALLPRSLRRRRDFMRMLPGLFRNMEIQLLILPEDNYFLDTHFFVRAAHEVGAVSVIVPFSVTNSLEWAETFHGRLAHGMGRLPNRVMARAFPQWTYEHKGERMIMPLLQILMNEYLGLTPPNPWLINSGHADALAAEGPYMVDYYRRAGIAADRIVPTGSLADDGLRERLSRAEEYREALYAKLNLPPGNSMLLISVPPNQLDGDGRSQCEFRNYAALLRALLEVARDCRGWNVVLSLHPRVDREKVGLIQEFPCRIANDDIASLVPLCDLFIASASATIRLAAAAGKPVVNYDVFKYHYSDYDNVPGVLTVQDYQSYRDHVRKLTGDSARLRELAVKQRRFADERTLTDGLSGERMLALFDRLTAKGAGPNTQ